MVIKFLKNLIKKNTMIFILIVVTVIVSSVILNFSYGLYQNYHTMKVESIAGNYSTNLLIRDDSITKGELEEFILSISDETNSHISIWGIGLYEDDDKKNILNFGVQVENRKITQSKLYTDNIINHGMIEEGQYFTKQQEESGALVTLIYPQEILEQIVESEYEYRKTEVIDNKTEILGKTYEVIGVQNFSVVPVIPFNSVDGNVKVNSITMTFDSIMTRTQYNELKEITAAYWNGSVVMPNLKILDNQEIYKYNTVMVIAVVISLIAALNIAILYRYILLKRKKYIAVFRICGCTRFKAALIYVGECLCLIIPFYILSALLYHYTLLPLFSDYYSYMSGAYSTLIYFVIFLIYLLLSLIVLFIMIMKESGKNPVSSLKGENKV